MTTNQVATPRNYFVKLEDKSYTPVTAKFTDKGFSYLIKLSSGPATIAFTFDTAPLNRKVKVFGRVVKDKTGKPMTVAVSTRSTLAALTVKGKKFSARSFCKPPDVWNQRLGVKLALKHLFLQEAISKQLSKDDYQTIVKICMTKPPKLSQIRRLQRLADKPTVTVSHGATEVGASRRAAKVSNGGRR